MWTEIIGNFGGIFVFLREFSFFYWKIDLEKVLDAKWRWEVSFKNPVPKELIILAQNVKLSAAVLHELCVLKKKIAVGIFGGFSL